MWGLLHYVQSGTSSSVNVKLCFQAGECCATNVVASSHMASICMYVYIELEVELELEAGARACTVYVQYTVRRGDDHVTEVTTITNDSFLSLVRGGAPRSKGHKLKIT